jgi:hypothetical protein
VSVVTVSLPPFAEPDSLLIDEVTEHADAAIAAHAIVDASPAETFAAATSLDLLQVRSPLITASFWLRGLPAKLLGRAGPAPLGPLTLGGDLGLPGWMKLGERPEREIAFGAVGDFWHSVIRWNLDVTPSGFAAFADPGWGKIACSYSVRPYGRHRSLLTYECRTTITDAESRAKFRRYWWLVRPFVQHVMNATVGTIAANASSVSSAVRD